MEKRPRGTRVRAALSRSVVFNLRSRPGAAYSRRDRVAVKIVQADNFQTTGYALPMPAGRPSLIAIREMSRKELDEYVAAFIQDMQEHEALSVLANPNCASQVCDSLARSHQLTSHDSLRVKLVEHRATSQSHSLKFVHYLRWSDLVRISTNVQVPTIVRRAIDARLLVVVAKLTLGEKIAAAKRCSRELLKGMLFDESSQVFEALLINPRLVEEDLIRLISSDRTFVHQLVMIGVDKKWSGRYAIRRALVLNVKTPKSIAASQLRFLKRDDLTMLMKKATTSVYLRRCIERMQQP